MFHLSAAARIIRPLLAPNANASTRATTITRAMLVRIPQRRMGTATDVTRQGRRISAKPKLRTSGPNVLARMKYLEANRSERASLLPARHDRRERPKDCSEEWLLSRERHRWPTNKESSANAVEGRSRFFCTRWPSTITRSSARRVVQFKISMRLIS